MLADLERVTKLWKDGALTDEEFAAQKALLLGTAQPAKPAAPAAPVADAVPPPAAAPAPAPAETVEAADAVEAPASGLPKWVYLMPLLFVGGFGAVYFGSSVTKQAADVAAAITVSSEASSARASFQKAIETAFAETDTTGFTEADKLGLPLLFGMYDKQGSAYFLSDLAKEQRETVGIWAMASRSIKTNGEAAVVGATLDGSVSIEPIWEGQAKHNGRTLPAVLLEARFNIVNRIEGARETVCVRKFSVVDSEFSMERSIMYRSCMPADAATIGEAMTQEGVTDIPAEYKAKAPTPEPASLDDEADGGQDFSAPDEAAQGGSYDEAGYSSAPETTASAPPRVYEPRPAQQRTEPATWITGDDYPSRALRDKVQGAVTVTWNVDPYGRVADCRVAQTSGSADLDEATCSLVTRRGRYAPATDAQGNAVTATGFKHRFNWRLSA